MSSNFLTVFNFKTAFHSCPFVKNNPFGPRSRYRKKPPAAAANQIAGNQKISTGMHE